MEKQIELMKDKNGRTMRTGDIVKIENAYFKSDNGYYFIDRAPGDASWNGSDYSLHKIGKRGKISTAKYNIAFWPLSSYCSDQRKNWEADAHNKENATIEIIDYIDNAEVIAHFKGEAEKAEEQTKYYEVRGYDWDKWVKVYADTAKHFRKVIERLAATEGTKECISVAETPTETTSEATETTKTSEARETHTENAETAVNGTDEPQTTAGAFPDMFAQLVKSYVEGKTAPTPKKKTATPSPVSKNDAKETPKENSGTPSGDSKNYAMGPDYTEGKSDTPSGDEKSYTAKTAVKYYEISEETARRAHEMMSFRDYRENSATDEYRASVDHAAEIAENQKSKVSPYYHDKIDSLLDRYARKLAEWTNAYNRNRASCPSVMVCGPANFPTRKKQKQNSREDTLWKEYEDIKGIIDKIKSVGTGAIDLADPHARELLQERLDNLKGQLELDKKLNAYWRKHKSFIGCPDISAGFAEKLTKETADMLERCAWMSKPFPDYELASLRDKIKRTAARLDELNKRQEVQNAGDNDNEKFDGGEIIRNLEDDRLQIIFDEKPDEETRNKLKSNGFRWSPRNQAWQRQLTANAERAVRQVLKLA